MKKTKDLAFVLDDLDPEPPVKKQRGKTEKVMTLRNAGSYLNIPKVKLCACVRIAWRCRLLGIR